MESHPSFTFKSSWLEAVRELADPAEQLSLIHI